MATTPRRLTDDQLASTDLRIADPTAVEGYTRERADPDLAPEIVGEYDLTPPGGLRANPDGPWIWCCHCQEANHWRGFLIANGAQKRYSIGGDCAAKYYDIEFTRARRVYKDDVARKYLLQRLDSVQAAAADIEALITQALHSSALSLIDAKRLEIEKACPNAFFLLASATHNGSPLYEEVQIRDFAAELARDDKLPAAAERTPIYTTERRAIGLIEGSAVVRKQDDCRDRLLTLRRALAQVCALKKGNTDAIATETMKKLAIEAESALRAAGDSLAVYQRAPEFFAATNVDRLVRWSGTQSGFTIRPHDRGIEFVVAGTSTIVAVLCDVSLPDLPPFAPV